MSSLATAQWVCHPSPPPNGFVIPRGSASEARGICSYWQLTTDNWQLVLGGRDGHDPASRRRSHEGRRVGSVGGGKCAEEGVGGGRSEGRTRGMGHPPLYIRLRSESARFLNSISISDTILSANIFRRICRMPEIAGSTSSIRAAKTSD